MVVSGWLTKLKALLEPLRGTYNGLVSLCTHTHAHTRTHTHTHTLHPVASDGTCIRAGRDKVESISYESLCRWMIVDVDCDQALQSALHSLGLFNADIMDAIREDILGQRKGRVREMRAHVL
jgi:hypothetical protein